MQVEYLHSYMAFQFPSHCRVGSMEETKTIEIPSESRATDVVVTIKNNATYI